MWILYLMIALFVIKTIAEWVPEAPPPPPPEPPKTYIPPKPLYTIPEPKPIITLAKMLDDYNSPIENTKDYLSISMEGSGLNIYPMFLTTHAAKLVKAKLEEDEGEVVMAFDSWGLMEALGIEKGVIDGNGLILYDYIYSVDVMTSRGIVEDYQDIGRENFDLDEVPIGKYFYTDNDLKGYTYCLIYCVNANKKFYNHEIDFSGELLKIPTEGNLKISHDAENIYYNGKKMYIIGDEWEFGDWWNPISVTLVKVSELQNIKVGDLEF
jgi:hypothetical protein